MAMIAVPLVISTDKERLFSIIYNLNGESKSFSKGCFVSLSLRLACSVGMRQSIPRDSSKIEIPHQPLGDRSSYFLFFILQKKCQVRNNGSQRASPG